MNLSGVPSILRIAFVASVGLVLVSCQGSNTSALSSAASSITKSSYKAEEKSFEEQRAEILERFRERREITKKKRKNRKNGVRTTSVNPNTRKAGSVKKKRTVSKRSKPRHAKGNLNSLIAKYARAEGIPIKLAHAVVRVESSYRVNARGGVGEIGLMQLRLSTARLMGYKGSAKGLYSPAVNLKYGMKYLGKARRLAKGNTCGTILRYNAGHGAKRMNPISRKYCRRVKKIMRG